MAKNQPLLPGGDLRLQLTSTGSPLPRQRPGGCRRETRPRRNVPELSVTVLIASGKTDGSFQSFTSTQRKRRLQNVKQSIRHAKISETRISKPRVNPAHRDSFRPKKPGTPMWFPSPGAASLLLPEALGLL